LNPVDPYLESAPVSTLEPIKWKPGFKVSFKCNLYRYIMGFRETPTETVLQHVTTPDTLKKFVDFRLKNLSAPNLILVGLYSTSW
jgi:hypothetical protein